MTLLPPSLLKHSYKIHWIFLHALFVYGIALVPVNWWAFAAGYFLIYGAGASIYLHRCLAHNTHSLPPTLSRPLAVLAVLSSQGPLIWWASTHVQLHHAKADKNGDMHSPKDGVLHSLFAWSFKDVPTTGVRWKPEMIRDPFQRFLQKHYLKTIYAIWFLVWVVSTGWFFSFLILPVVVGMWLDNIGNVICHIKSPLGYRTFATRDESRNVPFVAYLGFGNGWHNNHHHDPSAFIFGRNKWEVDASVMFEKLLYKWRR